MAARFAVPTTSLGPSPRARTHPVPVPSALSSPGGTRCFLHATVAVIIMSAVCGVARAQGTWSTAQLSVARYNLVATSVGNVAIFAGGYYQDRVVDFYNSETGRQLSSSRRAVSEGRRLVHRLLLHLLGTWPSSPAAPQTPLVPILICSTVQQVNGRLPSSA